MLRPLMPSGLEKTVHGVGKATVPQSRHDVVSVHTTAVTCPVEKFFSSIGRVVIRVASSEDGVEVSEAFFLLPELEGVDI